MPALADIMKKPAAAKGEEAEKEPASSPDVSSGYGDELASMLGVSDDDKSSFLSALSGYVRSCGSKAK